MILSVCIALIHNNNATRNAYVRPEIDKLINNLDQKISTYKIEIAYQPNLISHNLQMALKRDFLYYAINLKWRDYRFLKKRFFLEPAYFAMKILQKYLVRYKTEAKRWMKNSFIEVVVTDKHIRAWIQFLESGGDYLVVFEDDVVFKDDSSKRLNSLFNELLVNHKQKKCYVDLAGGVEPASLKVSALESFRNNQYRYYIKPVTNTACAYLMSKELVAVFVATITSKPWLRLIGIDWMMNNLFVLNQDQMNKSICMHSDPTIFNHGSTTGEYMSWQSNKITNQIKET